MESETYTPGHSKNAMAFMAQRTFETHGRFFRASLEPGHHLLDAGCGPGTITIGLAEHVESVIAVDFSNSQVAAARSLAADRGLSNVRFETANCYQLPFADGSFDEVLAPQLLSGRFFSEAITANTNHFRLFAKLTGAGLIR